jgi:NAD-dependent deacetylase
MRMHKKMKDNIQEAAHLIVESSYLSALTGAGISVESGIPPFRGKNGLWSKYDPGLFELSYFTAHPEESWELLKKLFFETFKESKPHEAHYVLARLEERNLLKILITQNIDGLHYAAGNRNIIEYHGTTRSLTCLSCRRKYETTEEKIKGLPPLCECGGILKPDIIFFGEEIPGSALFGVQEAVEKTDVMIVIGTTGEVFPASLIPVEAKRLGAHIIEVNTKPSSFSYDTTDIFLQGLASKVMHELEEEINSLL